jgi:hypothetical protein
LDNAAATVCIGKRRDPADTSAWRNMTLVIDETSAGGDEDSSC